MSAECTSCGHVIPAGQFRCGKCGGLAPRESMEDFGGLTELVPEQLALDSQAPEAEVTVPVAFTAPSASSPALAAVAAAERKPEEPVATQDSESPKETVPKGTFASETPAAPFAYARSADSSGEVKAFQARSAEPEPPAKSAAQTSSQRIKTVRAPQRPPFLASEILREDLSPREPGTQTLSLAIQIAGIAGFLGILLMGYASLVGILCAVVCLGIAVLARLPLSYTTRAGALAAISGIALAGVAYGRLSVGSTNDDPLLALACALLPAALLFRAWYRSAQLARGLVAGSLVLAVTWAALTSHRGLLTLGFTWQSWLPALAWYLFCILCLLSLLAFMGDETTGGCDAWALGLCVWFALFTFLRAAMEMETYAPSMQATAAALGVAEAAFATPLAIALAQLWARAFVTRPRVVKAAK